MSIGTVATPSKVNHNVTIGEWQGPPGTLDPYEMATQQLSAVARRMNMSQNTYNMISHCEREFTVSFPVRMDDGRIEIFTGHRVQHNTARGPSKGGIRFHPDIT